ncbi:hypothetical protein BGZ73_002170 [Actinomortierella ambigua]|nr:hypothetical protein BGZ73_002170 [Actinomortierella ambigua]
MATSERLLPHQQHPPHPHQQTQHQYQHHSHNHSHHHSQYHQHQQPSSPTTSPAYPHDPATHYRQAQQQPLSPNAGNAHAYPPNNLPSNGPSSHSHRGSTMQDSHQYATSMTSQQQQLRHNQSYSTGHPRSQSQQHSFPHPPPTQQPPPLPQQHHANIKPSVTSGAAGGGGDRQNRPPAPPSYQPRLHHSYSAGNIALAAATSKNTGNSNAGGAQAAPKKKDPYATAWRTYSKIAEELDLANPDGTLYPISKESILKYLHHQSKRIKSSNLHWYVNGLKKHQENLGFPWDEVRYDEEVVALLKELTLHPVMQQEREARENKDANNDDDRRGRQRQASGAASSAYLTGAAQQQQQQQQQNHHQYQGASKHDPMAYLQQPPPNFQPAFAPSSTSRTSQSPSQRTYYHSAPIQVVSSPMSPQSGSGSGNRRTESSHPAATRHYTSQPINTASIHAALSGSDKTVPPIDTRAEYMQSTVSKRKRFESMKRRVPSPMSPGDEEDEPRDDDEDPKISRHGRGLYDDDEDDEQMEDSSQYQPLKRRASTGTLLNQARAQAVNHVPGPYDINKLRGYKGDADRGDDGYEAGSKDRSGGYYSSHSSSADPASPPTTTSPMFRRPPTERAPQSPPQSSLAQASFGSMSAAAGGGGGKTTVQFTQVVDCAQRLQAKYGGRCSEHPWGCVETPSGEHLELTIKMYLDWAGLVASNRLTMDELPDLVEFKRPSAQSDFGVEREGDERSGATSGGVLKRMSSTPMGFHSQPIDSRYQDDPMSPTSPTSQQDHASFGTNTSSSGSSSAHSRAMSSGGPGYSDHHQHHHSHHPNSGSTSGGHRHTHSHGHGHHHQREGSEGYRRSPHRMYSSPPRHPLPSPPPNYNSPTSTSHAHQELPMSFTSAGMGIGGLSEGDGDSTSGPASTSASNGAREAKARRMASSPSLGRNHHHHAREFYSQPISIPVFNFATAGSGVHEHEHETQQEGSGGGSGANITAATGEQLRHHSTSPHGGGRTQGQQQGSSATTAASRGNTGGHPLSSISSMSSENEGSDDDMEVTSPYGGQHHHQHHYHRLRSPKSRLNGQLAMESFGSRLSRHENSEDMRRGSRDGMEDSDELRKSPPLSMTTTPNSNSGGGGDSLKNHHSFKLMSHKGSESGLHQGDGVMEEDLEREVNEIGEIGGGIASVATKGGHGGSSTAGFYEGLPNIQCTDPAFGQARSRARTRTRSGDMDEEDDKGDDDEYEEDVVMSAELSPGGRGPSLMSSSSGQGGLGPHHRHSHRPYDPHHHLHRSQGEDGGAGSVKKEEMELHHQHQVDSLTERANTITLTPAAARGSRDATPSRSSQTPTSSTTTTATTTTTTSITNATLKTATGLSVSPESFNTVSARVEATVSVEGVNSEAMDED